MEASAGETMAPQQAAQTGQDRWKTCITGSHILHHHRYLRISVPCGSSLILPVFWMHLVIYRSATLISRICL